MEFGKLYLIPNLLGESTVDAVLPPQVASVVSSLTHFIVENEKSARKFIKQITPEKSQQSLNFYVINKHTQATEIPSFLYPCFLGFSVGVISEAGCPGIADPGSEVVSLAHQKNICVVPLVGPSSILLAMMASGLNGQSFAFNGYLPIDREQRKKTLKSLERKAREGQTQIFIETPYRNDKMLADLLQTLQANTLLCIASDITLPTETIKTQTISQWKKVKVDFQKRPTIFIIG
ncbi:S-adenosylmethionine-dependent methyltransferase [Capnocytophaga canimorsus]|uniref:SAM-dependent methyltransferase n=1 Tax=Capnocytophaga canimorsus TaxID=28188 RepID=UPI001AC12A5B|nr:SAM-dependent methyltransferase [Capnocytophaga canimorsus]GIM57044.1 S-adenosylmethionine-dependent methyltransferase [Capnocytophaga canimorsus]